MGQRHRGPQRDRPDRGIRRRRVLDAIRRQHPRIRHLGLHGAQRGPQDRSVHALRHCRFGAGDRARGAVHRRLRAGIDRRGDRFRNRRHRHDRGELCEIHGGRASQDFPILRARQHHQHDRGPHVDPAWVPGPESRAGHGLHDRNTCHRDRRTDDRLRRRGSDGGRRFGGPDDGARARRILRGPRAVDPQ